MQQIEVIYSQCLTKISVVVFESLNNEFVRSSQRVNEIAGFTAKIKNI
jgi:hypothetical protein